MLTLECKASTICGKLANWKRMKKMNWLDKCCQSNWCDSSPSEFISVFSIARINKSTRSSSNASHRWFCYVQNSENVTNSNKQIILAQFLYVIACLAYSSVYWLLWWRNHGSFSLKHTTKSIYWKTSKAKSVFVNNDFIWFWNP